MRKLVLGFLLMAASVQARAQTAELK